MNNEYLLPSNEYNEFESRAYVDPSLQPAQTETFIDKLRETQGAHGQEITEQTEALGTTTPSNLGGLTGAGSYFSSRYQTPRANALTQNLRTTAQATALNQALANEQAIWKKRYNEAYRDYQKREHNKANTPAVNNTVNPLDIDTNTGGDETQEVSVYTGGEYQSGKIYPVTDYVSDYKDANGQWWQIGNPTQEDTLFGPGKIQFKRDQVNENVITVNGRDYIYLDNIPNRSAAWYPATRSAGPGTYSPYAGVR